MFYIQFKMRVAEYIHLTEFMGQYTESQCMLSYVKLYLSKTEKQRKNFHKFRLPHKHTAITGPVYCLDVQDECFMLLDKANFSTQSLASISPTTLSSASSVFHFVGSFLSAQNHAIISPTLKVTSCLSLSQKKKNKKPLFIPPLSPVLLHFSPLCSKIP